jgi:hypothetical protein
VKASASSTLESSLESLYAEECHIYFHDDVAGLRVRSDQSAFSDRNSLIRVDARVSESIEQEILEFEVTKCC